jgi:hypothetical protein
LLLNFSDIIKNRTTSGQHKGSGKSRKKVIRNLRKKRCDRNEQAATATTGIDVESGDGGGGGMRGNGME